MLKLYTPQPDKSTFWTDGYCTQISFKPLEEDSESIEFKLDGKWQKSKLVSFPEEFIEWNKRNRLQQLQNFIDGHHGRPRLAGPHNGIVATYGYKRDDSAFSLNNAVKGMGFIPKAEKLDEFIALLDSTADSPMPEKLKILQNLYTNLEENFDMTKQGSLELYSQPEYMTQSFLNQVYNPASTVVFLDVPSFKLKTAARLIAPNDPDINDYEKKIVTWINKIHGYFHGHFSKDFMAVVYCTLQVYDNSPRGEDPETGTGRLLVPEFP